MLSASRSPAWPLPASATTRGSATGWVAVGFAGAGAALLAARRGGITPGPCVLLSHTGIACPACGITRLAIALGHGDVSGALARDLPGTVLLLLLAVTAAAQLFALASRQPVGWLGHRALPLVLGALLAGHWALGIATGGFA